MRAGEHVRKFLRSFHYAFSGVVRTAKNERNMRVHLCFAFYVVAFGLVTGISQSQWAAVLLCIAAVTSLELINTSVETVCDCLHPGKSPMIRAAKDAAAGAVLISAAASAVVGGLIFFRRERVENALCFIGKYPVLAAVLILLLPLWIIWIVGRKKYDR